MEDITENNKLIAEFMDSHFSLDRTGGSYISNFINDDEYKVHEKKYGSYYFFENMRYHTSWDWLIPVVEKIESLGYFCMINKWTSVYTGTVEDRISVTTVEGKSKIKNTHKAVVEFIKWYNENKKD